MAMVFVGSSCRILLTADGNDPQKFNPYDCSQVRSSVWEENCYCSIFFYFRQMDHFLKSSRQWRLFHISLAEQHGLIELIDLLRGAKLLANCK